MKTILLKISFIFLFLSLMGAGCGEDESTLKTGKVIFYTNAQAMLNCGPFNVTVSVDDKEAGTISNPYVSDRLPDCANSYSTVVLEKTKGKHSYTARMECGQYEYWTGEFEIIDDKCIYIFLDKKDCIQNR